LVITPPQPAAKALAADGPGFPVTVDQEIGKGGAGGGVKELPTRLNLSEHVGLSSGRCLRLHNIGGVLGSIRGDAVGLNSALIDAGIFPQLPGDLDWVNAGRLPPSSLVAGAMDRAMMDTAERHGELIAGLSAERAGLQVAQVMRVGWFATADQAWLLGDRA